MTLRHCRIITVWVGLFSALAFAVIGETLTAFFTLAIVLFFGTWWLRQ